MSKKDCGVSLHPLKFDEVVTDILKAKPEPKKPNKKLVTKKTQKS